MSKSVAKAMDYELVGTKKSSNKSVSLSMAEQVNSFRLLWILVKRHKVGLLLIGNIILVLNWAVPEWPQLVRSLF